MKKFLAIILVCFSLNQTHAQPELLSSEMAPFGTTMTYRAFANVIDTSIQGPGSIWNFSIMIRDSFILDASYIVIDPSRSPYTSTFPNSNYCIEQLFSWQNSYYFYYRLSNSTFGRLGAYLDTLYINGNSQIELVFPLSIGNSNIDSIASPLYPYQTYYTYECIGSGTLILPNGTHNALMMRIHSNERSWGIIKYKWIDSDNGVTLISIDSEYDPYVNGLPNTYLHSMTIGIDEISYFHELNYQNPIEDNFILNYRSKINSKYRFLLNNAIGQEIFNSEQDVIAEMHTSLQIDFSSFASGIYFLNIRSGKSDNKIRTLKLVKP